MATPLPGKVALVTGGSRGIGAATALVLSERGFRAAVNYHASAPQAEVAVAAISAVGGETVAIQADVTAPVPTVGIAVDPVHIPLDSPALQALVRANKRALRTIAEQPRLAVDYFASFLNRLTLD